MLHVRDHHIAHVCKQIKNINEFSRDNIVVFIRSEESQVTQYLQAN